MGFFDSIKNRREKNARQKERATRNPQFTHHQDEYNFRRSRTLTGTTSSIVKSSNEKQAQLKSPRIKAQELRQHRRRLFIILLSFLVASGIIYGLLTQFTASISVVTFSPQVNSAPQQERYIEVIQQYLRERPVERFNFAQNAESMTQYVQSKLPEVKAVENTSDMSLGEGSFAVVLRQPVVAWKVGDKQYFVDDEGVSFEHNYYNTPDVTVSDHSGIIPDENHTVVASNRFLGFLGRVVSLANSIGIGNVENVTIPAGVGSRSIEIRLAGREYPIRMHIDREPAAQVEDMKRSIQHLEGQNVVPKYVDVRVEGKAFYRDDE